MAVSSTWILSLKVLLISSIAVLSLATVMKFSVPLVADFVLHEIPLIWSTLVSWLRPPYLYFLINGIIITIAASSRFHWELDEKNEPEQSLSSRPLLPDLRSDYAVSFQPEFGVLESPSLTENESVVSEVKSVVVSDPEADDECEEAFVISRSTWTPPQMLSSTEIQTEVLSQTPEKAPVSSRFGHRKPLRASPEGGRPLRVAKPKQEETMENMWKTITDGRPTPLTGHLKKCDTWENHGCKFSNSGQENQSPHQAVKKAQTFRDRTNYDPPSSATSSPGSRKLRKEPSLSQDELNRRVEAFIKKFNDEMRLQRQESLRQYRKMINGGAR